MARRTRYSSWSPQRHPLAQRHAEPQVHPSPHGQDDPHGHAVVAFDLLVAIVSTPRIRRRHCRRSLW
jgi:hypothetical protein